MAARKNRGVSELPSTWKDKIREGVLADRLMKHANGEIEMSNTQIKAADILLKKVIPDLSRAEHTGKDGGAIETKDITKTDADILALYINQKGSK